MRRSPRLVSDPDRAVRSERGTGDAGNGGHADLLPGCGLPQLDLGPDATALERSILHQDPELIVAAPTGQGTTCPWPGLTSYDVADHAVRQRTSVGRSNAGLDHWAGRRDA